MSNNISFLQKLIKGGVGIRAGGLENFSKINKRGGRLFGTREYTNLFRSSGILHKIKNHSNLNSIQ